MSPLKRLILITGLPIVCLPINAQSTLELFDSGSSFSIDVSATATSDTGSNASLIRGLDNLYAMYHFITSEGQNIALVDGVIAATGNSGTVTYSNAGGITGLEAVIGYTLTDGAIPELDMTADFSYTGTGTTQFSYINYFDYDIFDDSQNHFAETSDGGLSLEVSKFNKAIEMVLDSVDADFFEVDSFSTLYDNLIGGNYTLSNTGLPFINDDFTGAFQWDITLNNGQSESVAVDNTVISVPEMANTGLLAGIFALCLVRVRRSDR